MIMEANEPITLTAICDTDYLVSAISPSGWSSGSLSVEHTQIGKDLLSNYIFEGWEANGTIVSASPTYSFTVEGPASLTAGWKTEPNVAMIGAIVGAITASTLAGMIFMVKSF